MRYGVSVEIKYSISCRYTNKGTTSITFTGADFASGSTGTRFIYLIGTTADGLITILQPN
ncbi:hypothetical protein CS542_02715 [Pedobacter sp. IW39]|nr:hypothetical protein CS542_02715 [Pedobacter sp. IW39]